MPNKSSKIPRATVAIFAVAAILVIAAIILVYREVQETQIDPGATSEPETAEKAPVQADQEESPGTAADIPSAGPVDDTAEAADPKSPEATEPIAVQSEESAGEIKESPQAEPSAEISADAGTDEIAFDDAPRPVEAVIDPVADKDALAGDESTDVVAEDGIYAPEPAEAVSEVSAEVADGEVVDVDLPADLSEADRLPEEEFSESLDALTAEPPADAESPEPIEAEAIEDVPGVDAADEPAPVEAAAEEAPAEILDDQPTEVALPADEIELAPIADGDALAEDASTAALTEEGADVPDSGILPEPAETVSGVSAEIAVGEGIDVDLPVDASEAEILSEGDVSEALETLTEEPPVDAEALEPIEAEAIDDVPGIDAADEPEPAEAVAEASAEVIDDQPTEVALPADEVELAPIADGDALAEDESTAAPTEERADVPDSGILPEPAESVSDVSAEVAVDEGIDVDLPDDASKAEILSEGDVSEALETLTEEPPVDAEALEPIEAEAIDDVPGVDAADESAPVEAAAEESPAEIMDDQPTEVALPADEIELAPIADGDALAEDESTAAPTEEVADVPDSGILPEPAESVSDVSSEVAVDEGIDVDLPDDASEAEILSEGDVSEALETLTEEPPVDAEALEPIEAEAIEDVPGVDAADEPAPAEAVAEASAEVIDDQPTEVALPADEVELAPIADGDALAEDESTAAPTEEVADVPDSGILPEPAESVSDVSAEVAVDEGIDVDLPDDASEAEILSEGDVSEALATLTEEPPVDSEALEPIEAEAVEDVPGVDASDEPAPAEAVAEAPAEVIDDQPTEVALPADEIELAPIDADDSLAEDESTAALTEDGAEVPDSGILPEPAETVSGVSAEVAVDERIDGDLPVDANEVDLLPEEDVSEALETLTEEPPVDAEALEPVEAEAVEDLPGVDADDEPAPAEAVAEAPAEVIDDQATEVALPADEVELAPIDVDDSLAEDESTAALTEDGADVPDSGILPEPAETVSGVSAEVAVDEGIDVDLPVDASEAEILSERDVSEALETLTEEPPVDSEALEPIEAEAVEDVPGIDAADEPEPAEAVAEAPAEVIDDQATEVALPADEVELAPIDADDSLAEDESNAALPEDGADVPDSGILPEPAETVSGVSAEVAVDEGIDVDLPVDASEVDLLPEEDVSEALETLTEEPPADAEAIEPIEAEAIEDVPGIDAADEPAPAEAVAEAPAEILDDQPTEVALPADAIELAPIADGDALAEDESTAALTGEGADVPDSGILPEPAESVSNVSAVVAVDEGIDVDLPVDSGEAEILSDAEPPADAEAPEPIEAEAIEDMPGIVVAEEPAPAEAVVEAPAEVIDDQPTEVALPADEVELAPIDADDSLAEVESTAALTEEGVDVPDSGISPEPAETVSGVSAEVAVDEMIDVDLPVDSGETEILSDAEPPADAESPEPIEAEAIEDMPGIDVAEGPAPAEAVVEAPAEVIDDQPTEVALPADEVELAPIDADDSLAKVESTAALTEEGADVPGSGISPEPAETVSGVSAEVAVDEMIDVDLPVDSGEAEILSDAEPPADAEVPGPIEAEAIKDMPGIDVAEEPAPAEAVVEAPAEVIDDQPTEVAPPADDSLAEVESTAALTEEGADVPDSGIAPEPAETVSGASAEVAVDEGIDADRPVDAGEAEILSNAEPPMDAESPEPLAAEVVEEPGLVVEAVEDDAAQELTDVEAVALAEEIAPAAADDEKDGVDRAETASTEAILDDDAEPVASDADASRLAQADSVRPGDDSMSEMPSLAGEGGLTSVAQDQVLDSLEIEAEELLNELAFLDTASQQPSPFTGIGKDAGHAAINPPAFDIVRVDEFGSATVAGRAQQGARVDVIVDGIPAISAIADESGHFAANFDIGVGLKPVVISLLMKPSGKPPLESSEKVVVAIPQTIPPVSDFDQGPVPAIDAASPAAVLLAAEDSIELLQPVFEPEPVDEISDNVTIDAIYYDEEGEVVLSGRGSPGKSVIVYVDGKPEINEPIGHGGNWRLPLSEIEAGRYTLRIDEVDETGEVHSRVETPFQKELPEFALQKLGRDEFAQGSEKPPSVHDDVALRTITVQPGYTLWGMSRSRYGLGRYYVRIYAANKEQIRDPDLIYPGQVFAIPD